jgi:ribosomal protein L37AE/L43A
MHITDLTHYLDGSGAIGPIKGPALAMAQFVADVVAHATAGSGNAPASPTCFKCRKSQVSAGRAADDAIVWMCPKCQTDGRISKWRRSLWDLTERPPSSG